MTDTPNLNLEARLHALLVGEIDEAARTQTLWELAGNEAARKLLTEMMQFQQDTRAALGLGSAELDMDAGLSATLRAIEENTPAGPAPRHSRPIWAWAARIAAVVTIGVLGLFTALTHHQARELERQLAAMNGSAPAVPELSTAQRASYRQIWEQVAHDGNVYVLLNNGDGEFGSLVGNPAAARSEALLVQYRIVNADGQCVYKADLLVPAGDDVNLRLADAGLLGGHKASLAVSTHNGRAVLGLSVGAERTHAALTAPAAIGPATQELGSIHLDNQKLKVLVRTQPLGPSNA